ncbi:MAG: ABC-2 family transporter protein [Bdellovibrionota bacterium]
MLKKYSNLLYALFRTSLISDLEFRMNLAIRVLTDIIWYAVQLSIFEVLFTHTNSISGWTHESTRVFMGILFVVDALYMLLFSENLDQFNDRVRKGDLDLLLSKPVNSQFMISVQKMSTAYLINFFLALGWVLYSLGNLPEPIPATRLLLLFITIPAALFVCYGIRLCFSAMGLIFTRAENVNYLWFQLYRLGMRPDSLYPSWLRYTILSILPVGFIASVPTRLLIHTPDWTLFSLQILFGALALIGSRMFWNFSLKFYSSASS